MQEAQRLMVQLVAVHYSLGLEEFGVHKVQRGLLLHYHATLTRALHRILDKLCRWPHRLYWTRDAGPVLICPCGFGPPGAAAAAVAGAEG